MACLEIAASGSARTLTTLQPEPGIGYRGTEILLVGTERCQHCVVMSWFLPRLPDLRAVCRGDSHLWTTPAGSRCGPVEQDLMPEIS